jgi:hypothetical protein
VATRAINETKLVWQSKIVLRHIVMYLAPKKVGKFALSEKA